MENRPRRDLVSIRTVLDRSNSATPHQSEADGTQSLPDGHASITDNTHTAAPPAPTAAAAAPPSGANNESLLSLSTLVTIPQPPQLQGGGNVDAATHALPSQTGTTEDDGILVDKTDLQDDAHHAILGGTGTGAKPPRPTSARARPGSARSRPGSARRVTATTAPLLGATPGATGAQASSISEDASPLDKGSRGSDIPQLRESSDLNVNDPSSRAGSTPHGQGSEAARSASSQATTPDVAIPDFSHRSGSRLSATEDDVGAPLEDTAVGSNPQAVDVNDKQSSRSALQAGEAAATEQQAKVDAVTDMSDRPVEQLDQPERQPSGSKDGSAPERQSPTLPSDGRITDQAEVRKDEPDGSAEERIAVTSTSEEGAEAVEQKSPAPVVSEIKESVVDQNGRSSEEKLEEVSLAPKVLFGAADASNSATSPPHAPVTGETHDAAHASDKHNPLQDPVREAPHQSVDTSEPAPAVAAAAAVENDGAGTTGSHQPERPPSATAIPRAAPASMPAVDVNRFWHNEDEEDEQLLRMEESELAAARALTAAIASRAALSSSFPSLPGGTTSDSAQDTTSVKEATQDEAVQEVAGQEVQEEGVGAGRDGGLSSSGAQRSATAAPAEGRTTAEVDEAEKAAADAPSNVAASNPSAVGGAAPNTAGSPEAQANVALTPPEGVRFVDRVNSDRDVAPQVEQDHERQEQARGREEALRAQPMDEVGRLSETASRDAEEQKRPSATSVDTAHAEMVRFVNPPADATVPLGDQPSGNAQSSNNASVVSKRSTTSQKIELSTPGPTPSDSIPVQLSGTASDAGTKDSRHRHRRKHRRRRQTSDAAPSFTAAGSPEGAADSVVRDLGTSVADAARVDSLESEATDAGRKRLEPSSDALPPARVLEMPVQTPSTVQQEEVVEAAILATPGHDDQRAERKDKDGKPSSHRRRRHHRDRRASADVESSAKATDQSPVETTPSSATVPPLPSSRPDFSAANHDDENIQVHGVPAVLHAQEIPHAQEPSPPIAHGVRSDAGVDRKGPDSPPPSPNGGATDTTRQDPPVVVADASEDAESPIEAQPSSSVVLEVDPPPPRGTAAPGTTNVTLQNTGVQEGSSPAESSACDAATPVEALPSSSVVLEGQEDDFRSPPQPSAEPQSAELAARPASESAESPVEALPSSSVVLGGQREFGAAQPSEAEPRVERTTDDDRPASADDFLRRSGRGGAATISDVDVVECEARAYVLSDEADALASITNAFGGASARALVEEKETAARQHFMSSERQGRTAAVEQGLLLHKAPDNSAQVASTSHHDVSASGHNSASDVAVQRSPLDEDTDAVAMSAGNEIAPNPYPVPVPDGEGGDKQEATPLAPAEIVNSSSLDNDHGGAEEEVPSKDSPDDTTEEQSVAAAIAAAAVTGSVEDAVSLAVIGAATEATIENVAVAALVAEETSMRLDINDAEQKAMFDATSEHELIVKSDAEKRAHVESQRLNRVFIEETEHQNRALAEAEEAHVMTQLQRSSNDEAETIRRSASQAVAQEFAVTVLVGEAEGQTRDARTTQEEFELRRLLERRFDTEKSELLDRNALGDVATLFGEELRHRHVIEGNAVSTRAALQSQATLENEVQQKTVVPVPVSTQREKSTATPPPQSPLHALLAQITASPKPDRPLTDALPSASAKEDDETSVSTPKDNSAEVEFPEVAALGLSQSPVAAALEEAAQGFVVAILVEAAEAQSRDSLTAMAEPQARALLEDLCEINQGELLARNTVSALSFLELAETLARGDVVRSEVDADLSLHTARQTEAVAVREKSQREREEASADTAEAVPAVKKPSVDLSTATPAESAETTTTPSREAAPDSSRTPKTPNLGAPLQALLAQITRSPADRSISSSKPTPTDQPALTAAPAAPAAPPLGPLGSAVPTTGALNANANMNSLTGDGSVGRSGFAVEGSSARALLPPAVVASAPVGSNSGAKVNGDGDGDAASSPMDAPALITTTTRGRPSVPIIGGRGRPSVPFTPSASGISFSPTGRASLSARGRGPSSSARMSRSVSPTASSPDGRTWRQRKSFIAGDIDDEGSRERLERARQYRASSRSAERSDGGDSFVDGTSPFGPTPAHALIETTPEAGAVIEAASPAPFNNGASGLEQNRSNEPTTPEAVKPSSVKDDPVTPKTPEVGQPLEGGDASPGLASDGAAQETMLPPDVTETEAGAHATSAASTPDGRSPFDDDHPDAFDNVSPTAGKAAGAQVQGQEETTDVAQPPSVPIAKTVQLPSVHRTVAVVRRSPLVVVKMMPRRMVTTSVYKSTPSLVRKSRPTRQRTFATVRATPVLIRKSIPARVFVHAVKKQTPVVTREVVPLSSTTDEGSAPSVLEGYRKELSVLESQQGAASSTRTVQISEESLLRAGLTDAQIAAVLSGGSADGAPASLVSVVDEHPHATDRGAEGPAGRELGEKDEKLHVTSTRETNTDGVEPALLDHQTQTSPPDIVLPVADVGASDPVRDAVDATDENASPPHVQESGSEAPDEQHAVNEPDAAEPSDAVVVLPLEEPRSVSVGREVQTDDLVVEDPHPRSESVGREMQTDELTTAEDDEKRRHEQQELVSEVVSVGMHGLMSLFFQEQERRDKLVRDEHMRRFLMKDEQEVEVIARQFDNPRSITARLETMESAARTVLLVNMEWQAAHFTQCASLLFEKLHRAHVTTVQEKYERIRCEDAKDFIIFQARSGGFGGYGNERREHSARASNSDRRSEQTKDEDGADGSVPLTPTAPAQDQAARNQSRRELYADRTIGTEDTGGIAAGRKGPRLFTAAPSRSHGGTADVFASAATKATERLAAFPSPQQYARTNVEVRPDDGLEMMRTRGDGGGLATCLFARKEHADTAAASSASPAKDNTAVPSSQRTLEATTSAADAAGAEADTASIPPLAETPATHNGDTATDAHRVVDGGDDNGHELVPPSVVDSFEDTMRSCYTPFGAIPRLAPTPDHEATNGSLPTPRSAASHHHRPMSSTTPGVKRPTAPGPRPPSGRPPQRPASAAVVSRSTDLEIESKKNGWGDQGEVTAANRQSPNEPEQGTDDATAGAMSGKDGVDASQEKVESEERENFFGRRPHETQFPSTYSPAALPQRLIPRRPCASPQRIAVDRTVSPPRLVPSGREHVPAPSMNSHGQSVRLDERTHPAAYERATAVDREHGSTRSGASATRPHMESATEEAAFAVVRVIPSPQRQCPARFDGTTPVVAAKESPARDRTVDAADDEEEQRNASQDSSPAAAAASIEEGEAIARTPTPPPATVARSATTSKTTNRLYVSGSGAQTPRARATTGAVVTPQRPTTAAARRGVPFPGRRMSAPDRPGSTLPAVAGAGSRVPTRPASVASGASNGGPLRHGVLPSNRKILSNAASSRTVDSW